MSYKKGKLQCSCLTITKLKVNNFVNFVKLLGILFAVALCYGYILKLILIFKINLGYLERADTSLTSLTFYTVTTWTIYSNDFRVILCCKGYQKNFKKWN